MLKSKPFGEVVEATTYQVLVRMLLAGRIDCFPEYRGRVKEMLRELGVASDAIKAMIDPATGKELVFSRTPYYLAFSAALHDAGMADAFSEAVRSMKDDGTYFRIERSYM